MVKESLVSAMRDLIQQLKVKDGIIIDKAALVPAYEGMVAGLFMLTVSMPDGSTCSDKTRCLIHALHQYVPQEARQSIVGVRIFDSAQEFDQYLRIGYHADSCEVCEEMLAATYSPSRKPELLLVEA